MTPDLSGGIRPPVIRRLDAAALTSLPPFEPLVVAATGVQVPLPPPFARVLPAIGLPDPVPTEQGGRRPPFVTNFVAALDGTVRLSAAVPSSKVVALGSHHDWLLLGLLRTIAPTIVVGALPLRDYSGLQDGPTALRALATEVGALRASLGWGPIHHVVVCGSGVLPVGSPVWGGPATVVTTPAGAERLSLPAHVEVIVDAGDGGDDEHGAQRADGTARVGAASVARVAIERTPLHSPHGAPGFVLAEPGPGLFAELLAAGVIDEAFLTTSPVLAGAAEGHLRLTDGAAYARLDLISLSRVGSHLFGRWRPTAAGSTPAAAGLLDD